VLKWLITQGAQYFNAVAEGAVVGSQLEILKWLKTQGCKFTEIPKLFQLSIQTGSIEVMEWLANRGAVLSAECCKTAAIAGHLEAFKWLRKRDCPCNYVCFEAVVCYGHLPLLKWMVENVPMKKFQQPPALLCDLAADHANVDILRWLREQGMPWTASVCTDALATGKIDVLRCLHQVCLLGLIEIDPLEHEQIRALLLREDKKDRKRGYVQTFPHPWFLDDD
jgi:hypothetical protein